MTAAAELIIPAPAPRRGEEIEIRRPGAPTIWMRFERLDYILNPSPGWLWLYGEVLGGLENGRGWRFRTLYARPVERGVYEMVPHVPLPECGPELAARNARILAERLPQLAQ